MTDSLSIDLKKRPLSYSQMSEFLTCRYRWFLSYVLGIRPIYRSPAMEIGDAVHRAIAAFLTGQDPEAGILAWESELISKLPIADDAFVDQIESLRNDALKITERALMGLEELGYWSVTDDQGPIVEREYVIPVKGWDAGLVVKVDWVSEDQTTKMKWVTDFKTRNYFTNDDDEFASLQNIIYQHALAQSGIPVNGALTFQIKSTPPKLPKQNKDGTFSRAAVACDWETYAKTVREAGQNPLDYLDMKEKLGGSELIRVVPVIRNETESKRAWTDVIEPIASTMAGMVDHYQKYGFESERVMMLRNLSPRTCNHCGVRSICHGAMKGQNVGHILAQDFKATAAAIDRFHEF